MKLVQVIKFVKTSHFERKNFKLLLGVSYFVSYRLMNTHTHTITTTTTTFSTLQIT